MPRLRCRTIFFIVVFILATVFWYSPSNRSRIIYQTREDCTQDSGSCSPTHPSSNPIASASNTSVLCSNPPRGQCAFYRECLENRFHCGPEGYPIGYGEKFCEKFVADQDKLSAAGQQWMLNTMHCLQLALVPEAESMTSQNIPTLGHENTNKCDEVKQKAFDSHAPCYIKNGLCTLGIADWAHIVEIINFRTLFGSWDAVKETLEAAEGCLEFYAFLLIRC
ncbi:hypothetical protein M422DRAFT_198830 [Sphaerobolus stellatus SS14]|nr:hypothetical protein M422DRAFT_198830 [Sphaerobolus stellatus SS14]